MSLENVKPGDELAVVQQRLGMRPHIMFFACERVTNTQVVLVNGRKYRKSNGAEVGCGPRSYRRPHIEVVTDKLRKEREDQERISLLSGALSDLGRLGAERVYSKLGKEDVDTILSIAGKFR